MDSTTKFIVRRAVSGGETGLRTAIMKKDGEVILFVSRHDAQAYANKCNAAIMSFTHHASVEEIAVPHFAPNPS